MASYYRAFTPEFIKYLRKRGGPPKYRDVIDWFKCNYGGLKTEFVAEMVNGRYTPEKCTTGFIEMLMTAAEDARFRPSAAALRDYLANRQVPDATAMDLESVLSHVCLPLVAEPPEPATGPDNDVDYLELGTGGLMQVGFDYMLRHAVQGMPPDSPELDELASWVVVRVGQCISPTPTISHADAKALAASHMGITEDLYAKRSRIWHAFNPWIVVKATQRTKLVGTSTVLPLTETAYQQLMAGERPSWDMGPADFEVPSRHLVLETCAENPRWIKDLRLNPSRSLLMCMALQLAALMRFQANDPNGIYKWVSFAATPLTRKRLISVGFRATGAKMAVAEVELMERVVDLASGEGVGFMEGYVFGIGGKRCPASPPCP